MATPLLRLLCFLYLLQCCSSYWNKAPLMFFHFSLTSVCHPLRNHLENVLISLTWYLFYRHTGIPPSSITEFRLLTDCSCYTPKVRPQHHDVHQYWRMSCVVAVLKEDALPVVQYWGSFCSWLNSVHCQVLHLIECVGRDYLGTNIHCVSTELCEMQLHFGFFHFGPDEVCAAVVWAVFLTAYNWTLSMKNMTVKHLNE